MNKAVKRTIILILISILLIGCASSGKMMEQSKLDKITIGVTTKDEMIQMFGNPMGQGYNDEGKLSMSWFYIFVGPMGLGMQQQSLIALFNEQNIVEKYNVVDSNGVKQDKNTPAKK